MTNAENALKILQQELANLTNNVNMLEQYTHTSASAPAMVPAAPSLTTPPTHEPPSTHAFVVALGQPKPKRKYTKHTSAPPAKAVAAAAAAEPVKAKPAKKKDEKADAPRKSIIEQLAEPDTLGAAMKRWLYVRQEPFTIKEIDEEMHAKHADLCKLMSETAVQANIYWWAKRDYLKKIGSGQDTTFEVLAAGRAFFKAIPE